jgi:hypothetical protein
MNAVVAVPPAEKKKEIPKVPDWKAFAVAAGILALFAAAGLYLNSSKSK